MTSAYDRDVSARLIAEARDAKGEWEPGGPISGDYVDGWNDAIGEHAHRLADQLEAAGVEVERLRLCADAAGSRILANLREAEAIIATLTAERDHARKTAVAFGQHADAADMRVAHEMTALKARVAELEASKGIVEHQRDSFFDCLTRERARVAELEAEVAEVRGQIAPLEAQERICLLQINVDDLTAAIRTIYPVYAAAERSDAMPGTRVRCSLDAARAVIDADPAIREVVEAIGKETTR